MNFEILGDALPVVVCTLSKGETIINESGSMVWMSDNVKMETVGGGVGKMFGRILSGENLFQNRYTAQAEGSLVAFASSFPGCIYPLEITPDRPMILQKSAFLAATSGVELSMHFNKKFSSGLFGGEGFIMQKVSGNGTVFAEVDGHGVEYDLAPGQSMLVDTGNLAMMDATCTMEIQTVPGVKNMLFGGEGLFLTKVTGPGSIVLQSMPISTLAGELFKYLPNTHRS